MEPSIAWGPPARWSGCVQLKKAHPLQPLQVSRSLSIGCLRNKSPTINSPPQRSTQLFGAVLSRLIQSAAAHPPASDNLSLSNASRGLAGACPFFCLCASLCLRWGAGSGTTALPAMLLSSWCCDMLRIEIQIQIQIHFHFQFNPECQRLNNPCCRVGCSTNSLSVSSRTGPRVSI